MVKQKRKTSKEFIVLLVPYAGCMDAGVLYLVEALRLIKSPGKEQIAVNGSEK